MGAGINVVKIRSGKFRTNIAAVMFRTRLKRELAAKNALLLKYLSSGSEKYPNISHIERKCMDMFGSVFSSDIVKKGGEQILVFYIEIPETGKKGLFRDGCGLLNELVFHPDIKNGAFDAERLERARKALKEDIASAKDDKRSYAFRRFAEEMFSGESFGIPGDGYAEDTDSITPKELYRHYKILLNKAPVYLVFAGSLKELKKSDVHFDFPKSRRISMEPCLPHKPAQERYFHEEANINQGRLVMGFSTGLPITGRNIAAGKVFSEIFGGSGGSKLYDSVREKEGLAYYVSASFSPFTMCISVEAGINGDAEKAVEIIKNEMLKIKEKGFSEEEIRKAKTELLKRLYAASDSKQALMDFALESLVLGQKPSIKRSVCYIKTLDYTRMQRFINALKPDTVYFLGKEASHDILG